MPALKDPVKRLPDIQFESLVVVAEGACCALAAVMVQLLIPGPESLAGKR